MNNEALKKLNGRIINNVGYKNYPHMGPSINSLERHIEIYKLIDEYVGLHEDLKKVETSSSRVFINNRMTDIETELLHCFWIVKGDEMVPREKEEMA